MFEVLFITFNLLQHHLYLISNIEFRSDEVGKNIVRAAKEIIIMKQTDVSKFNKENKIDQLQQKFQAKVDNLEAKLQGMENKMDLILRKLTKF